jgi:hypothetical protein
VAVVAAAWWYAFAFSVCRPSAPQGDNNRVDDRGLYAPGQQFIGREDILGRAVGTLR